MMSSVVILMLVSLFPEKFQDFFLMNLQEKQPKISEKYLPTIAPSVFGLVSNLAFLKVFSALDLQ